MDANSPDANKNYENTQKPQKSDIERIRSDVHDIAIIIKILMALFIIGFVFIIALLFASAG